MSRSILPIWVQPSQEAAAHAWQQQLQQRGQDCVCATVTEPFGARWLRQHPQLALLVDAQGLWLAAAGMKMQPDWQSQWPRLQRASRRGELLARACGLTHTTESLRLVDATAGLGHDTLLLAALGAQVVAFERDPVVAALLADECRRSQEHAGLRTVLARVEWRWGSLTAHVEPPWGSEGRVDTVYVDPMFAHQDLQSAKVKKPMQLLHALLHQQTDEHGLLTQARTRAKRVVVKRPRHGSFLEDMVPDHQWLGEAVRFDGYFQASVIPVGTEEMHGSV